MFTMYISANPQQLFTLQLLVSFGSVSNLTWVLPCANGRIRFRHKRHMDSVRVRKSSCFHLPCSVATTQLEDVRTSHRKQPVLLPQRQQNAQRSCCEYAVVSHLLQQPLLDFSLWPLTPICSQNLQYVLMHRICPPCITSKC